VGGVEVSTPFVGVGCLIRRGHEILLVRRRGTHGSGTWSTPGGYLDLGEDPSSCALREALEETGVTATAPRFVGLTNDVFEAEGKHFVTLWFEADYSSGDATVSDDEVARVGWFREDDLPAPVFLPLRNLLAGRVVT
jgi:8-oxo-dGTP diphosphatase